MPPARHRQPSARGAHHRDKACTLSARVSTISVTKHTKQKTKEARTHRPDCVVTVNFARKRPDVVVVAVSTTWCHCPGVSCTLSKRDSTHACNVMPCHRRGVTGRTGARAMVSMQSNGLSWLESNAASTHLCGCAGLLDEKRTACVKGEHERGARAPFPSE
jgi:hypothetical protein